MDGSKRYSLEGWKMRKKPSKLGYLEEKIGDIVLHLLLWCGFILAGIFIISLIGCIAWVIFMAIGKI